jgi:hypothetical protein
MSNENQRVENLIAVAAPSRLDNHALATKFRLFTEDGTPIDVASFDARLRALEGNPEEGNHTPEPSEEGSEEPSEEGSEEV